MKRRSFRSTTRTWTRASVTRHEGRTDELMDRKRTLRLLTSLAAVAGVSVAAYTRPHDRLELDNRIPEAAPYDTTEARVFPPPYEEYWKTVASPGQCQSC